MNEIGAKATTGGDGQAGPVFNEVSIVARQLILGSFDRLMPKDDTLLTRGGGTAMGLKLYDELERDPKAWEVLEKRKMSLASRPWRVAPPEGDTSRAAKKAADMVRAQLTAVGFDQVTRALLDANLKGISTNEVMWRKDGSEIIVDEVLDLEPWMFQFALKPDPDEYTFARCGVRLLTAGNFNLGEKVPHRKFLIHRFGAKYNNPWGLGLGTRLFWPIFFKRQGMQFWLSFAERFGTPVPVGKYPNNAQPAEKATLRRALQAFQQEASIMVPQGMEITLLEAAKSGIDTYERLCKYMDDQTASIVLGKPGGNSGGQLAAAVNTENDIRLELVKADGDLLSDTLNRQLVRWIVDYNMPGAPYPSVTRTVEESKNIAEIAKTKKTLFDMGFRPTLESIKQDFGGDYTEIAPPASAAIARGAPMSAGAAADFAEPETPADQAAVDAMLSTLADEQLQGLMERMLAPIIKAVRESADHQAALEKLVDLFPDVPLDDLQESLARGMFALDTWGRLNVEA
jgi:phage gp29-like protein